MGGPSKRTGGSDQGDGGTTTKTDMTDLEDDEVGGGEE